jgi:hypothetical protein
VARNPSSRPMRHTTLRQRIYIILTDTPTRSWTIAQVIDALAQGGEAHHDAVRAILLALLDEHIMMITGSPRTLALKLTPEGIGAVRAVPTTWAPASAHKRGMAALDGTNSKPERRAVRASPTRAPRKQLAPPC